MDTFFSAYHIFHPLKWDNVMIKIIDTGGVSANHDGTFNTLRPRQKCRHYADIFIWIFGMKMYSFLLKFHWHLFQRVQLIKFQHWFRWWLGADQATSHYPKQWSLVYWRIYASPGLNELIVMLSINGYDGKSDIYVNLKAIHISCIHLGCRLISNQLLIV